MKKPSPSRALSLAFLLAFQPACSWLLVQKVPEESVPASPPVRCTSSVAAPVLDTVLTALLAGGGIALIAASSGGCSGFGCGSLTELKTTGYVAGGLLLGASVPAAFSAAYGYGETSTCRNTRDAQLSCVSGVEAACEALRARTEWPPPRVPEEQP